MASMSVALRAWSIRASMAGSSTPVRLDVIGWLAASEENWKGRRAIGGSGSTSWRTMASNSRERMRRMNWGDLHEPDARLDPQSPERPGVRNQDPALVDVAGDELDLERLARRVDETVAGDLPASLSEQRLGLRQCLPAVTSATGRGQMEWFGENARVDAIAQGLQ